MDSIGTRMRVVISGMNPRPQTHDVRKPSSLWRQPCAVAIGLACGLGLLAFPYKARADVPAEAFVASAVQEGNAILSNPSLDARTRDREFRQFLLSITDMKRVALFALGSYAKTAPNPIIASFVSTFTDFDVALYQGGFGSYGQSLKIISSTGRSDDDVIVNAEAGDPKGKSEPMKIAFRVRKDDAGKDIILDVAVQGVWLAVSQQQGFTSYLQLHGGDVGMLTHELESRTTTKTVAESDTP